MPAASGAVSCTGVSGAGAARRRFRAQLCCAVRRGPMRCFAVRSDGSDRSGSTIGGLSDKFPESEITHVGMSLGAGEIVFAGQLRFPLRPIAGRLLRMRCGGFPESGMRLSDRPLKLEIALVGVHPGEGEIVGIGVDGQPRVVRMRPFEASGRTVRRARVLGPRAGNRMRPRSAVRSAARRPVRGGRYRFSVRRSSTVRMPSMNSSGDEAPCMRPSSSPDVSKIRKVGTAPSP